jgi:UDP-N-acetylglucosamine:LPS N-acetylglucosamine transferase
MIENISDDLAMIISLNKKYKNSSSPWYHQGNNLSKILFISGSIGMGHVTRDLAIAREFRKVQPNAEIIWLAGEPAVTVLRNAGEKLAPEAGEYNLETDNILTDASNFSLNLAHHIMQGGTIWKEAYKQFEIVAKREKPDLVVGDEAYEIAVAFSNGQYVNMPETITIFDFVKSYPMSHSPKEMLVIWMVNRSWHKAIHRLPSKGIRNAFVGEPEDVPDEKLGLFLSNAKESMKGMTFLGEILRFDPKDYTDKKNVKAKLGYGDGPLIVVSIGGTAVGRPLLKLCAETYPLLKKVIPNLHMVLVGGPMLDLSNFTAPEGVEVRGFVPNLYEHFAASDISIVQAGGTTVAELIALQKPFLYFPLEGHYEQQICVSGKAERHKAGVKMIFSETTPENLAKTIEQNIGIQTSYKPIRTGGEKRMGELMTKVLAG